MSAPTSIPSLLYWACTSFYTDRYQEFCICKVYSHYYFNMQCISLDFCRVVMALDLELWFIRSILFIGIISSLGPKLVMIRKMVRVFHKHNLMIYYSLCRQMISYYLLSSLLFLFSPMALHQEP